MYCDIFIKQDDITIIVSTELFVGKSKTLW